MGLHGPIVCHFCPHACSNDDYAYRHLVAIHLNIQWGCGMCYGYVQSHCKKSSRERSRSSHRKDDGGKSDSFSDGISSNDEWSAEEFEEDDDDDDDDDDKESGSYADEVSPDASDPK